MKIYYVCENGGPEWFNSYGVLENGFCFGQHLCSHPNYAPGDLLLRRKNRLAALKEIFGVEPTDDNQEIIVVNSVADIPEWWNSHEALQEVLKPQYERYAKMVEDKASAELDTATSRAKDNG